jgi:DNA topoisomerase-1
MVQIGDVSDEEKPRFAKLKADQSIETITFAEAMDLFRLPRQLGEFESMPVQVNIGRFGPYISHDGKFYSLPKELDPYSVTLADAEPVIVEKRRSKEEKTIKVFEKDKIQLLRGPYGPYIKKGLRNFPIPKERQEKVAELEIDEVRQMIEEALANPPRKKPPVRRKKA